MTEAEHCLICKWPWGLARRCPICSVGLLLSDAGVMNGLCVAAQVHEAIMRAPSDEVPDGTVLQEFRKGFTIGKTLLRPAMVQVRRRKLIGFPVSVPSHGSDVL